VRTAANLLVAAVIAAGFPACAKEEKPKFVRGTPYEVSVEAGLDTSPRSIASAHCARFEKKAVLRDVVPDEDNAVMGWTTGSATFIYYFDCR
jgi:hypothetical protein